MSKKRYTVRSGCAVHTDSAAHGPGDSVELTDDEAAAHLHKIEPAADESADDTDQADK